ncbi:hypothetical protein FALBO_13154 [Fusarium albosuccineum]|uniref:Mid2 domain-containing protein n=1 Tax=Fusarium albosuccineum TaxID=1237068 RepID=A0A8H4PGK7_9HYPO|nr:hypothetical protein FALBO_13154 [Fusarium albosuccineum]
MTPADLMARLPPAASLLVLSSIVSLATGHALPRPTKTVDYHELNVVPFPLVATPGPEEFDAFLLRRQLNTVCGYVGGDPALPATCSAGSHCVADVGAGAVGCCPDEGACTQGVFTGCVDADSGPQTEVNPYEGGFFQFGCGSTSGLATNVVATASGKSAIQLTSIEAPLTATATSLSEPTTLGTKRRTSTGSTTTDASTTDTSTTKTSTTKTSTTETTSSATTESSTESTESETETETASTATNSESASATETDDDSTTSTAASAPDTDGDDNGSKNTGAIIGGTISGVAALAALVALGIFLWRRKKGNTRQGPGLKHKVQHVGPVSQNSHNFSPLPSMQEVDETRPPPPIPVAQRNITPIRNNDAYPGTDPWDAPTSYGYGAGSAGAVGGGPQMEHDEMPLTREVEDFNHNYNAGLGRISEEEPRPGTAISTPGTMSSPMAAYPGPRGGGGGPLWQQNRGPGWL